MGFYKNIGVSPKEGDLKLVNTEVLCNWRDYVGVCLNRPSIDIVESVFIYYKDDWSLMNTEHSNVIKEILKELNLAAANLYDLPLEKLERKRILSLLDMIWKFQGIEIDKEIDKIGAVQDTILVDANTYNGILR